MLDQPQQAASDGVPANGSCTVAIRFAPGATGPRAATLTLDPAGPQRVEVALTGTGAALHRRARPRRPRPGRLERRR